MRTDYQERVLERLGPHSEEKNNFHRMASEWVATGRVNDRGVADGECGICGHQETRWEFELQNAKTAKTIDTGGSTCICVIDEIGVADGDGGFSRDREQKHVILSRAVNRLVGDHKREIAGQTICAVVVGYEAWRDHKAERPMPSEEWWGRILMRAIRPAWKGEGRGRGGTKVSPGEFSTFLWMASEMNIIVPTLAFQGWIDLSGDGMDKLKEIQRKRPWQFQRLLPVLTPAQRKRSRRDA